ncbi:Serine 3-dehydrogenase [Pseudovibrio axinellae]|uniref:Serine 3-dehydrogenase n=1 Tax=Pseudovibrio axinellae TaxID=989403 RepID=A0A165XSD3_9HYPH|nr:SDR family NAD(P)-dependent oxidoreductase [Pseudovibrio axinellae]KZL17992.1 Serine 3-dehydrogenase [Pseudovibrio axinellae]SER14209.1 Short-chain dehydrogenase [Pseudovibrio axinellae]
MTSQDKIIWIIGATSGIGEELCKIYAADGWQVIASGRRAERLAALEETSDAIRALRLDVTDKDEVALAVQKLDADACLPDLTLYCAGVFPIGGFSTLTDEICVNAMDTNYFGAVRTIHNLFPLLKKRGSGQVAIISSLSGYGGLPFAASYGPTKAALINLCESLKPSFDKANLTLSVINPGFVKTDMTKDSKVPMPFIISAESAAKRIKKGLARKGFETTFPLPLAVALKLMRFVPYWAYFKLVGLTTGKQRPS